MSNTSSDPYIEIPEGRNFKELGLRETVIIGDQTHPWTLITLGDGNFLQIQKDQYGLFSVAFEREFPHSFGSFTSKVQVMRSLRDYAEKNGLKLTINYLSDDGASRYSENPKAI